MCALQIFCIIIIIIIIILLLPVKKLPLSLYLYLFSFNPSFVQSQDQYMHDSLYLLLLCSILTLLTSAHSYVYVSDQFCLSPISPLRKNCLLWYVHVIKANKNYSLTLLILVPFSYKLIDAPFETIRYCGFEWWNNCVQCWFPKWFWMVGQLIQNLVWIFPIGSTANTKPCLDTSKWWINGPSKTIWMTVLTACYQHCSNGITMCVQNQWAFLKVEILNGFKWSISRKVNNF